MCVQVLNKTLNLATSRCCFAVNCKEMYYSVQRTSRASVLPIKTIIFRRCRCRRSLRSLILAVRFPPGISGAFFHIVCPRGRLLAYSGYLTTSRCFTSQHFHFLSMKSLSAKTDEKFVLNISKRDKYKMVDSQNQWGRNTTYLTLSSWSELALVKMKVRLRNEGINFYHFLIVFFFFCCTVGHYLPNSFVPVFGYLPLAAWILP